MAANAPSLWNFSLAVYAREGVAEACLGLQDRHGLDVNLLLFCLWRALAGARPLGTAGCRQARAAVDTWQRQVVQPLRSARRALKPLLAATPAASGLRDQVKAAELEAERLEQLMLADVAGGTPGRAGPSAPLAVAAANLKSYCAVAGIAVGAEDTAALAVLLAACFPAAARAEIEAAVG